MNEIRVRKHLSTFQIIILGFLLVILTGTVLLMLPFATREAGSASLMDALFTATSATCVTGLVVEDTATYWSGFGQAVILTLIQIGGMGVVTLAVAITIISGKKIGLMQRSAMQESIAAPQVGGIVRLTRFIVTTTLGIELLGAICMFPVFYKDFGLGKGIWYSVWHSVSAFCNAGFDLMGVREHYSSLVAYVENPLINIVIMLLIIIGGIGFLTWNDIRTHKWHLKKYRMQSKIVFVVTAVLLVLPALYFYFIEFNYPQWAWLSEKQRFWGALFQAVTPRTAGFNTLDLTKMSEPGQAIMTILMLIGGSPGSTAGGMKTTTIAVLILSMLSVFGRREHVEVFDRRVASETVKYAAAVLIMYLVFCLGGGILISSIEQLPILECIFEAGSAIGTVGLTLGLTPNLSLASHIILTVLMYFGRVGGLTVVFAAVSGTKPNVSKAPKEKITVG
ncbi:MAG: Trk family potassium uptake protein [Eubacterium sp.]|nr:Trk family potassium uptake protein [Eubacterium sp.]